MLFSRIYNSLLQKITTRPPFSSKSKSRVLKNKAYLVILSYIFYPKPFKGNVRIYPTRKRISSRVRLCENLVSLKESNLQLNTL